MSCTQNHNTNDVIRRAVRAEVECGRNWMGATATLADWLDVSPQIVRMRFRDEVLGEPRRAGIVEGCWQFLDNIARRQRLWLERLDRDIQARRDDLQMILPLETNTHGRSGPVSAANRVARAESELARAHRAMADFRQARAKKT